MVSFLLSIFGPTREEYTEVDVNRVSYRHEGVKSAKCLLCLRFVATDKLFLAMHPLVHTVSALCHHGDAPVIGSQPAGDYEGPSLKPWK